MDAWESEGHCILDRAASSHTLENCGKVPPITCRGEPTSTCVLKHEKVENGIQKLLHCS